MIVELSGKKLVIDPGSFTAPVTDTRDTVAIVVTHEHADHWTTEQLDRIFSENQEVPIFAPAGVVSAAQGFDVTVCTAGDSVEVGPFRLKFFGGQHAIIHRSIPVVDNLGVLVNEVLYYPGDSLYVPAQVDVDMLGVPVAAPWSKISEVMDFVEAVSPRRSFPVHEMVLSTVGKKIAYARVEEATTRGGGHFFALEPNESIEV
jgi:L-ascorbate metabolism protein UlaG (beta-lactamase superfamily)